MYSTLLEKYQSSSFCEKLVDINEARLLEATLNLQMHAWIFSHLSVASVNSNQHLSEVVFIALVGFSLLEK